MIVGAFLLALQVQSAGDSITLAEAMARARSGRARAIVAAAQVAEARAAFRSAGAVPNPGISYTYSDAVPTNHIVVVQSLDWLLRRGSDRAAARAGVSRAVADSTQTMTTLARDVRIAFWRARATQVSQTLVEEQAVQADSLTRIAAARFRAGDISLLEREQAAQEAARAHQAASLAREGARVAAADLARELGAEQAPRPVGALDSGLDRPPGGEIEAGTTPALRAALADSAAAAAAARSASAGRVPLPTIQGGTEWGDPVQPGALAVVGFSLPLPLWQRGGGPVAQARARALGVGAAAREARLDAIRDVRQARIRLEEAAGRARVARDSLIPAAGSLRARALRAYQAGETGIVPVLDAFRSERDVVLGGLQDQLSFQEAAAEWDALAGRVD